jgi:hypothetical protein
MDTTDVEAAAGLSRAVVRAFRRTAGHQRLKNAAEMQADSRFLTTARAAARGGPSACRSV